MRLLALVPTLLAIAGLVGCTGSATSRSTEATASGLSASDYKRRHYRPVEWPLRFRRHEFQAVCYDTQTCSIWYANTQQGDYKPSPPSSGEWPQYLSRVTGAQVGIRNFPPAAKLDWISKGGTRHVAEIDIREIFREELLLHDVPREEVADQPDGRIIVDPTILLEINDRTVRVYIRSYVPTKTEQIPGNVHSHSRDELVLARTYHY